MTLPRMQNQLLCAPVEELADVQLVLGGTCKSVNPAELLQHLARAAEPAEHLAIERQLVDAAGKGICHIEILRRPGRDAHGPRRAGSKRSGAWPAGFGWAIADGHRRVGRSGHLDAQDRQYLAGAIEDLNACIAPVGDV